MKEEVKALLKVELKGKYSLLVAAQVGDAELVAEHIAQGADPALTDTEKEKENWQYAQMIKCCGDSGSQIPKPQKNRTGTSNTRTYSF
jgi:hypothetical protein